MRFPNSWTTVPVAWICEKIASACFYAYLFGRIYEWLGFVDGCIFLFVLQMFLSVAFLWIYDFIDKDIFALATVKEKLAAKFHREVDSHPMRKGLVIFLAFIATAYFMLPPLVAISFRRIDTGRQNVRDVFLVFLGTIFATVIWTCAYYGGIRHIKQALFG